MDSVFLDLLVSYDDQIMKNYRLNSIAEEIYCSIRENLEEFPDGFYQHLDRCMQELKELENKIWLENGMRLGFIINRKRQELKAKNEDN